MNLIGIFILTALIFEFALHRLSEALNLRSASATVPDAFKDCTTQSVTPVLKTI